MLPVIAIVGRPNVGKSTLFNRLTHTNNALVSDFAGLTRDRQYGEASICGHKFIVIDTGGITTDENEIEKLAIQQSLLAISESDKILFLVDARGGILQEDLLIAEKLRSIQKPIQLVVNKTEGLDQNIVLAEFYKLGFGEPIAISASHGSGIDDLVQHLFLNLTVPENIEDEDEGIKIAIIGRPNVGKSTLTNRMLGEERVIVYDQPGTTRDSIYIPLERYQQKYTLIDTAGIRRKGKIFEAIEKFSIVKTLQAIQNAKVILFIIDAREGVTDQDLKLLGFIIQSGKALVIAINKWDGMSVEEKEKTKSSLDRRLDFINYARIHYISALHGSGVGNLFDSINEAYESAQRKISTPQASKILEKATMQHSPPMIHGRRVKLRYAHVGGHNPPTIIIHGNQVNAIPESYRRYLINFFQQKLKLIGTPIRIEFKSSLNPYRHKKNVLTDKQKKKKQRLMRHTKR